MTLEILLVVGRLIYLELLEDIWIGVPVIWLNRGDLTLGTLLKSFGEVFQSLGELGMVLSLIVVSDLLNTLFSEMLENPLFSGVLGWQPLWCNLFG